MLHVSRLRQFYELSLQGNITNNHLKHITEGLLLSTPPPPNALSKQKRAMRRIICKPCNMPFKRFMEKLTEINNFLPILPGSEATKKMTPEELNEILLNEVANEWANK